MNKTNALDERAALIAVLSTIYELQNIDPGGSWIRKIENELQAGSPRLSDVQTILTLEDLCQEQPPVHLVNIKQYLELVAPTLYQWLRQRVDEHQAAKNAYWKSVAVTPWE